eukprot:TRINITY_DN5035_c0_g1_i1.p1 TRINITY_DN5035_c0_g1~~TRINITY_DN5035_c0_g1_i1.p1  ORF type:complete len:1026 (-),score=226.18 TRINITY_DN5035_c0_g1_i1:63-3140(-)
MIRRPPRSTLSSSSAASDVYKRQVSTQSTGKRTASMRAAWVVLLGVAFTTKCTCSPVEPLTVEAPDGMQEATPEADQSLEAQVWQTQFSQIWPSLESSSSTKALSKPSSNLGFVDELPRSVRVHLRVKATEAGTSGVLLSLGPNDDQKCKNNLRILYDDADGGQAAFGVDVQGDEDNPRLMTTGSFELGQSYSIDVTYDTEVSKLTVYVNGVPKASAIRKLALAQKADIGVLSCDREDEGFQGEVSDIRLFAGAAMPKPPFFSSPQKCTEATTLIPSFDSIPLQVRIHLRLRIPKEPQSGPLVLLGGSPRDCALALQVSYRAPAVGSVKGTLLFGVEGRSPHALEATGVQPDQHYVIDCAYNHQTRQAKIYINGKQAAAKEDLWGGDELRGHSLWKFPATGALSVLSVCHTETASPVGAEVSDLRLYSGTAMVGGDQAVVECEVAPWEAWGACDRHCGGGTAKRQRVVLVDAQNGGATCPATHESRSCNTGGCTVERCFLGDSITPECHSALESALSVRMSGARRALVGFGIGEQDGRGWPQDGEFLDSSYAAGMARLHSPRAAAAEFATKAKEGGKTEQGPKLLGVYMTDDNTIRRWDAETNKVTTLLENAAVVAAPTEPRRQETPGPLESLVVQGFAGKELFFAAGPAIRAMNPATGGVATVVGGSSYGVCGNGIGTKVKTGGTAAMAVTPSIGEHSLLVYADAGGALMVWDSKTSAVGMLAGKCGLAGSTDGSALNGGRVGGKVQGIALESSSDADGSPTILAVYFTDGHAIRRLQWTPPARGTTLQPIASAELLSDDSIASAQLVTLVGVPSTAGYRDSLPGVDAVLLDTPTDLWVDHFGPAKRARVHCVDSGNGVVRVVDPSMQTVSTLASLPHTRAFQVVSKDKGVVLSSTELVEVDLSTSLSCDALHRILEGSFKAWRGDDKVSPLKEQLLSAKASLTLKDNQALGRTKWDLSFFKKVKHVGTVNAETDQLVGSLTKITVCAAPNQDSEHAEKCCVRKYASPVKGMTWTSMQRDLKLW